MFYNNSGHVTTRSVMQETTKIKSSVYHKNHFGLLTEKTFSPQITLKNIPIDKPIKHKNSIKRHKQKPYNKIEWLQVRGKSWFWRKGAQKKIKSRDHDDEGMVTQIPSHLNDLQDAIDSVFKWIKMQWANEETMKTFLPTTSFALWDMFLHIEELQDPLESCLSLPFVLITELNN